MRLVWLVLVLFAVGCSPSRTVYLSDDEPDSVAVATVDAVDFWNDVVGFEALSVRVVSHAELGHVHPGAIVVVSRREVGGAGPSCAAQTAVRGPFTRVTVERANAGVELLAHELGHALGLAHHGDALKGTGGRNLMRANNYGRGDRELTRRQVRRVRGLLLPAIVAGG